MVGEEGDDRRGVDSGSVYVFDAMTGSLLRELIPLDPGRADAFGVDVAIQNQTAVVGAIYNDDRGSNSGAAYVFDVNTGQQKHKLLPSDGQRSDEFGCSVAISGNLAIVGARGDRDLAVLGGSAYIFDASTGMQLFKLLPPVGIDGGGFGWSVAIDGDFAVVGAPSVFGSGPARVCI